MEEISGTSDLCEAIKVKLSAVNTIAFVLYILHQKLTTALLQWSLIFFDDII